MAPFFALGAVGGFSPQNNMFAKMSFMAFDRTTFGFLFVPLLVCTWGFGAIFRVEIEAFLKLFVFLTQLDVFSFKKRKYVFPVVL